MSILYFWVEGSDDERFFKKIVKPNFENKFDDVKIIEYAKRTKDYCNNFLRNIKRMGDEYFFITDYDNSQNFNEKIQYILKQFENLDEEKIYVVKTEIEGWYLSGLNSKTKNTWKLSNIQNTDNLDKEQLLRIMPRRFVGKTQFLIEILKNYSLKIGIKNNLSLNYFYQKEIA